MTREEVLRKLLQLGPLEPLHAREVCGWPVDEFENVMKAAIDKRLIYMARGCNQYRTRLVAA